ncbi:hypothetical protein ciss_09030 [Carboxydothermus islandicus]|uniref:Uncharacterized protein n=1 Tax=Carboxydothermus islandicus TaxID=661089 RepID=A0A1L8D1B7_9THEO|nr:hypothetical protein ciss_09030 [Carboxydothermus islandicus]
MSWHAKYAEEDNDGRDYIAKFWYSPFRVIIKPITVKTLSIRYRQPGSFETSVAVSQGGLI